MSAFSDGVECSVPSARSGETPDPSDFCDSRKVYSFLLVLSLLIMLFMYPLYPDLHAFFVSSCSRSKRFQSAGLLV